MKSAEEWCKISIERHGYGTRTKFVQDIQADALRHAAGVINGYDVGYDGQFGEGWRTRKEICELVLAEADRLEKGNQPT